jgi:hypothetical protein
MAFQAKPGSMFRRILREPLVHFLALALMIFIAYGLLSRQGLSTRERIEVGSTKIEQLTGLFTKSWQRPPTAAELKGLIDDYVTTEIYSREALAMGLDTDDSVIRQRLRMKMELLTEVTVDALSPRDEELAKYLSDHAEQFQGEPQFAIEQVFLSREKRGTALQADAASLLEALRSGAVTDPGLIGDPTLLPQAMPLSRLSAISGEFGAEFADATSGLQVGVWSGPVNSAYGLHLVKVGSKKGGSTPTLAEVRDAVLREWKADRREEIRQQTLAAYASKYDIVVDRVTADPLPTSE